MTSSSPPPVANGKAPEHIMNGLGLVVGEEKTQKKSKEAADGLEGQAGAVGKERPGEKNAENGAAIQHHPSSGGGSTTPASDSRSRASSLSHTHAFQHKPPNPLIRTLKTFSSKAKASLNRSSSLRPTESSPALSRRNSARCRPPAYSHTTINEDEEGLVSEPNSKEPKVVERRNIKIRLVSWNMHDSLPSGDLTDFLGEVKLWKSRRLSNSSGSKKTDISISESSRDSFGGGGNDSVISIPTPDKLPPFPLTPDHPYHLIVVAGQECPTASGVMTGKLPRTWDGQGWTRILEEWLCGVSSEPPEEDDEEGVENTVGGGEGASLKSRGTSGTSRGVGVGEEDQNGPYILVEKERLMGIYLAVFVARSCDGLIDGISKSRVPAGLIGGRVGNKGACGISINFAGSRLLFISAHLAAHASGLEIRKMNIKKIMEGLEVDDFKGNKDDGVALSDRFDQTFFLGDLNMRLNITRLHADWLTKSQDYATALQFDQLRGVLAEDNSCLKGFQEAPITFAPTYKYDVITKIKRKRSEATPRSPRSPKRVLVQPAIDVFDLDPLVTVTSSSTDPEINHNAPLPPGKDSDNLSVASTSSAMSDYDRIDRNDLATLGLPSAPAKGGDTHMDAVRRAQVKFLTLVRANSSAALLDTGHKEGPGSPTSPKRHLFGSSTSLPVRPILRSAVSDLVVPMSRNTPPISAEVSDDEDDGESTPVFDSSSKQRVQSYTDRILFKSTIGLGAANTTSPSRNLGVAFTDSLRSRKPPQSPSTDNGNGELVPTGHPHHPYFAHRPVLDHFSKKIEDPHSDSSQHWSDVASVAGEPRHRRFANFFGRGHRRGMGEPTAETFTSPPPSPTDTRKPLPGRSISFTPGDDVSRKTSLTPAIAPSTGIQFDLGSSSSAALPRRASGMVRSMSGSDLPAIAGSPTVSFPFNSVSSPSTAPTTPTMGPPEAEPSATRSRTNSSPRKTQRSFSMAESTSTDRPPLIKEADSEPLMFPRRLSYDPSAQNDNSESGLSSFFRGPALSLTRTFTRSTTRGTTASTQSHSRFKSFFHLLPLPFLTRSASEDAAAAPPVEKIGPRKGEIQALLYGSVADLVKMGAQSDHRPVYSVVAIGVDEE